MKVKNLMPIFTVVLPVILLMYIIAPARFFDKNPAQKQLTSAEALDTCFTKIAEQNIYIDTNRKFLCSDFLTGFKSKYIASGIPDYQKGSNETALLSDFYTFLDSLSSAQKTYPGFKKIYIYQLKYGLSGKRLNEFVNNKQGIFLSVQDLAAVYRNIAYATPPDSQPLYTWIIAGNYCDNSVTALNLMDKGNFFFTRFGNSSNYKWKKGIAIAYAIPTKD